MASKILAWGLVLKPTEAGRYLAPHIAKVEQALNGSARPGTLHYTPHGECRIQLAPGLDETEAHALATRLNSLMDEKGRPVLEVEITSESLPLLRAYPAADLSLS